MRFSWFITLHFTNAAGAVCTQSAEGHLQASPGQSEDDLRDAVRDYAAARMGAQGSVRVMFCSINPSEAEG